MHERTERAIARLLFVFCCAIPTMVTLLLIVLWKTPWYHRKELAEWKSGLSRDTGLVVNIDDFHRISPYKSSLQGMRLMEPEYGREVIRVREITWLSERDRTGIVLRQPEFQSAQLYHAWNLIHDRYLCSPDRTSVPLQLSAHDLTIQSDSGPLTLREFRATVEPQTDAIQANIECVPATRDSGSPVKITIRRDRGGSSPTTQWTLETGAHPLPCSALADWLPLMRSLGSQAEFAGMIQWEIDSRGHWVIDLGGSQFSGVDLGRLCEDLPHRVTAETANVHLDRCYIDPGKTVRISGSIVARVGWMGQSLLKALHDNLDVAVDTSMLPTQLGDVPYELLGVHFRISDSELKLGGICNAERGYELLPPGVLMCTHQRAIAQTSDGILPSVRLVRALSPEHSQLVPIASQTRSWMNLLVAPNRALPVSDGMAPAGRIRRAESWSGGQPILQR